MSWNSRLINVRFAWGDHKRDAGLTTPKDVVRFDDIRYGEDEKYNLLDVYKPKAGKDRLLPVIINVHGGAWVYGDKERSQYYCMGLSQRGFAVVNFSYRLAPVSRFPAQMEDINHVVQWVLTHGAQYGLDQQSVFMTGDSAGAHMAALYCCACTNQEFGHYAVSQGWKPPEGFVPAAVALNCGIYEFNRKDPRDRWALKPLKDLLGRAGTEEYHRINPLYHVDRHFPPVYLMTSTGDFLREQAGRMAQVLKEREITFIYKIYGTEEHPLPHVFHCNMREPEAAVCNDEECHFFLRILESRT